MANWNNYAGGRPLAAPPRLQAQIEEERRRANSGLAGWAPRIATAGVTGLLGAAAAPLLFGGGGAGASGAGGWSMPGVTAPTFGAGAAGVSSAAPGAISSAAPSLFSLGNILRMGEIGIPAITSILGQRSQNRALDRQTALEQASLEQQIAFAREQEAQRRAEAERMFGEDQRRWEAEERNRARELAAMEEERAFNRRLIEEREGRRAPFRQASEDALYRLRDILRMGGRG